MRDRPIKSYLKIPIAAEEALIAGARSDERVSGLTHGFYKYPARFSPVFVRAAIETFTVRGDIVVDNHVGGGTTLVEAMALGRNSIGIDISALAEFVATVKTTTFSEEEFKQLEAWAKSIRSEINIHKPSVTFDEYAELGYYRHLNHPSRWRLRKAIEQAIGSAVRLKERRLESFGRCAVLRAAQWAIDGRKKTLRIGEFRSYLEKITFEMISSSRALSIAVLTEGQCLPTTTIINRSAAGIEADSRIQSHPAPKLVLTSPPYPGVHILYHRWQVDGGKEVSAPFWIAGKLDGAGGSYYTMGDRKNPGLKTYFDNIQDSMSSIVSIADENTLVVQMVAFSDSASQLPRYIETMAKAGLTERFLWSLKGEGDGRLWRTAPRRRWYSEQRGATPASQEVVLFHIKNPTTVQRTQQLTDQLSAS